MKYILIIEDSAVIAEYLLETLSRENYNATIVSTGKQALGKIKEFDYQLVVLDLNLPDISGMDVLKKIRQQKSSSEMPVIAVSAIDDRKIVLKTLEMGANEYMVKPVDDLTFLIKIKNLLQLQESNLKLKNQNKQINRLLRDLEESKDRYKLLSNLTFEGIVLHNNGMAINMNASFARMFGYKKYELFNRNLIPLLFHQDDVPTIRENVVKQYARPYEVRGIKKDGTEFMVEIEAKNTIDEDREIRVGAVRDITWRKEAEKTIKEEKHILNTILDNLPDIIAIQKPDHTILSYNAKGYKILNQSPEAVNGKKCFELIGRKMRCEECATQLALESKKTEMVEKFVPELGMWVNAMSIPVLNENDQVNIIIEKIQDISEWKKTEQIIEKRNMELKELNQTKDKLFSIIGHDLKSPLNSLLGFAELLGKKLDHGPMEKLKSYQQAIYSSATTISTLLEDLLQWSWVQRDEMMVRFRQFDVNQVVDDNFRLYQSSADCKNVKLINKLPKPTFIYADKDMVNTVVRNLLSNAIKFTHAGGNIRVTGWTNDHKTVISVKDDGTGIPEENLERLFEIDEKKIKPGTAGDKGTGLGLVICREFIHKNNGTIWVKSPEGEGSEFFFELPLNTVT